MISVKNYKVLIVEDDNDINSLISNLLNNTGYNIVSAYSGTEAKRILTDEKFDLILLDLMLPGLDGESLIKWIREEYNTPIIVISAKIGISEKVNALNYGADDYITKPFSNEELLARIEAQLRRNNILSSKKEELNKIITYKNCIINTETMEVKVNDNILNLTVLEYNILLTFLQNQKTILTRNNLFKICWKEDYLGTDNTVDVHISRIRNKIAKFDKEEYIETIRGIGYRLKI